MQDWCEFALTVVIVSEESEDASLVTVVIRFSYATSWRKYTYHDTTRSDLYTTWYNNGRPYV
jgi:hypothetical protein